MINVKQLSAINTHYVVIKIDNFRGRYRKLCFHMNTLTIGKTKNIAHMT